MKELIEKAQILVSALPYIKRFNGITIVIKYGGSAITDKKVKDTIIQDIALMKFIGFNPVVVHGGGKDISSLLERLDIESEFVDGLRVTSREAMEVVEMALSGKINKEIVSDINDQGVSAVGISGKDAQTILARKLGGDVDYGMVGEIQQVNVNLIETLIHGGFVPVISPVGVDADGNTYNINADYAAAAIAGALGAEKLVFLTDVRGIMTDTDDINSVLSEVDVEKVKEMLANKTISGGMIPKVECCLKAIENGAKSVHILDGTIQHSLILEIFTIDGIGTLIKTGESK